MSVSKPDSPSDTSLTLDLRPVLAAGSDPLADVVEQAKKVIGGGRMVLLAPFNPLPLRNVLAQMGFSSEAERLGDKHWRVTLVRDGRGTVSNQPGPEDCGGLPPEATIWIEGTRYHIDVRGMAMPMPMLAILRLVSNLKRGDEVMVHHDRDPVLLYPELAEIGWSLEPRGRGSDGELLFLLRRD